MVSSADELALEGDKALAHLVLALEGGALHSRYLPDEHLKLRELQPVGLPLRTPPGAWSMFPPPGAEHASPMTLPLPLASCLGAGDCEHRPGSWRRLGV